MNSNYFEVVNIIKDTALQHPFVRTCLLNVWKINSEEDIKYPVVSIGVRDVVPTSQTITYTMNIFYADRLMSNRDNQLEIKSVAIDVLTEIINKLEDENHFVIDIDNITLFNERFADLCAGGVATVTITTPSYLGDCYFYD